MYYIGVRDEEKEKWKKKANINHSILVLFPTIYLAPLKVNTKFEVSGLIGAKIPVMKCFIERKKNGQIKGTIGSSMLILFHTIQQHLYQI